MGVNRSMGECESIPPFLFMKGDKSMAEEQEREVELTPRERTIKMLESVRKYGTGTLKLQKPLRSHSQDVPELTYDMTKITGMELAGCLDGDSSAQGIDKLTAKQSMNIFALSVEKCMRGEVDARDVKEQMGLQDAITAIRVATVFFNASSRLGDMGITVAQ